jgi:hypothetical protein
VYYAYIQKFPYLTWSHSWDELRSSKVVNVFTGVISVIMKGHHMVVTCCNSNKGCHKTFTKVISIVKISQPRVISVIKMSSPMVGGASQGHERHQMTQNIGGVITCHQSVLPKTSTWPKCMSDMSQGVII